MSLELLLDVRRQIEDRLREIARIGEEVNALRTKERGIGQLVGRCLDENHADPSTISTTNFLRRSFISTKTLDKVAPEGRRL